MKKLIRQERIGHRIEKDWLHYGNDGRKKITTEIVEDVNPVFAKVKTIADAKGNGFMRHKASIPFTLIDDTAKISAKLWGVTVREAFAEILSAKTGRAKRTLKMLTEGRDYRKLQSKAYA